MGTRAHQRDAISALRNERTAASFSAGRLAVLHRAPSGDLGKPFDVYARGVLGDCPLMVFIAVRDLDAATSFYTEVLGLRVTEPGPSAVVLDAGGAVLRLTRVDGLRPQLFTVAGWHVTDIVASIDGLVARGVGFIRYEVMEQDERGIWTAPSGDQVAWFKDPDGNVLSLTSFVGGAQANASSTDGGRQLQDPDFTLCAPS